MSFNTGNIAAFTKNLRTIAGTLLSPHTVTPYQGTPVDVKLYVGRRRAGSADLTGGADQENQYATIDGPDWDAKVGRIPQKGDVIEWAGRRMAVMDCQIIAPEGNAAEFYKARLRG